MFLMFVDESGDSGSVGSPTEHFVLSGIVIHELRWRVCVESFQDFRSEIRRDFGLKLREEIHASEMLLRPGDLARIKKHDRLAIIRRFADRLASIQGLNVVSVHVRKTGKPATCDVFENA